MKILFKCKKKLNTECYGMMFYILILYICLNALSLSNALYLGVIVYHAFKSTTEALFGSLCYIRNYIRK